MGWNGMDGKTTLMSLAQGDITGNCQYQNTLFVKCERNPELVIESLH